MFSFMRTKDGKQPCQRCGGHGCFNCGGLGVTIRCPGCGSMENFSQNEDSDIRCNHCGSIFSSRGTISDRQSQKDRDKDQSFKPL
jgi:hypothetical protein